MESRLTFACGKEYYVDRNHIDHSTRSDASRRLPGLATQPELGLRPERRPRVGAACRHHPAPDGQNLSGMTRLNALLARQEEGCGLPGRNPISRAGW